MNAWGNCAQDEIKYTNTTVFTETMPSTSRETPDQIKLKDLA